MASTPHFPQIKINSALGRYQTAPGLQPEAACLPSLASGGGRIGSRGEVAMACRMGGRGPAVRILLAPAESLQTFGL